MNQHLVVFCYWALDLEHFLSPDYYSGLYNYCYLAVEPNSILLAQLAYAKEPFQRHQRMLYRFQEHVRYDSDGPSHFQDLGSRLEDP